MTPLKSQLVRVALAAGFLSFAHAPHAFSQDSQPEKSQALLQKVKQGELDRRIALKQTEIDRLKEDLDKSKKDLDALQKNLDATAALITESNGIMDQLSAERRLLEQTLDLTVLRIEAERKKSDGLKSLSAAQSRALDAINERMAEMDVQSSVREAEVQLLSQGKPVPGEDNDELGSPELHKLKKTLASDQAKTITAEAVAREAMKSASARLEMADEAAARAKRMADSMSKTNPEPVGEQTEEATPAESPAASAPPAKDAKPGM